MAMRTKPRFYHVTGGFPDSVNPEKEEESEVITLDGASPTHTIVVFNDEVNTFTWVIRCLVELCGHDQYQAEQCAWIIHTRGKYAVKHGNYDTLAPICQALCDRGLSASLIENI